MKMYRLRNLGSGSEAEFSKTYYRFWTRIWTIVSISEVESQTIIYDDVESLNVDASTAVVTTSTNNPSNCAQDETEQQSDEDKINVEDTHIKAAKARPLEEVSPSVPISSKRSPDDIDEQSDEDKMNFEVSKKKRNARKSVKKFIKKEKVKE
ncbi:LOW QUALITY PROTEIN: hypothetical protein V2J09_021037 [Rumex salicifolius]